jgi:short-subunit dehydrogenase
MHKRETIWIIGASEGLGAALARKWASHGARLILSARTSKRLEELTAELGGDHIALPMDVSARGSVNAAAAKIAEVGPLDRVIHLAAIYDPGKVADLDPDMATQIININLTGRFHIAQIAPALLCEGAQFALCGSVAGYIGLPQGQIYSATKAGVINLAETMHAELSGSIDVRLISPRFVDTRLTQRNEFTMPAIMAPQSAAIAIIKGLSGRKFEVHLPRRMTYGLKLLQALPYWALFALTRRLTQ